MSFEANDLNTELVFHAADGTEMRVLPDRCLINGFKVGNWDVLYSAPETRNIYRCGLPILFPNFSSLEDGILKDTGTKLGKHGFSRDVKWSVEQPRTDGVSVYLESNDNTTESYPFDFKCTCNMTVLPKAIRHELIFENKGDRIMPVSPGLHPYLSCPVADKQNVEVSFASQFNMKAWNWASNPPDNEVAFDKTASFTFPGKGKVTYEEQPGTNGEYYYKKMYIWCEPDTAKDHNFICFEPVVWGPNGLNLPEKRINVPPKGTVRIEMLIKVHAN